LGNASSGNTSSGNKVSFYLYFNPPFDPQPEIGTPLSDHHFYIFCDHPIVTRGIEHLLVSLGGELCSSEPMTAADFILLDIGYHDYETVRDAWRCYPPAEHHRPVLIELHPPLGTDISDDIPEVKCLNKPILMSELLLVMDQRIPGLGRVTGSDHAFPVLSDAIADELAQLSVLIVDDNHLNREVTASILDEMNIHCLLAINGQEAIALLSEAMRYEQRVDLIFMDCHMPGMDGYACTKSIRSGVAGESFRTIPIVAMTAHAMVGERAKCIDIGMDDYLPKPVSPENLIQKILQLTSVSVENVSGENMSVENMPVENNVSGEKEPIDDYEVSATPNVTHSSGNTNMSRGIETVIHKPSIARRWRMNETLKRMMGNQMLFDQMVSMYLDSAAEQQQLLKSYIDQAQRESIRQQSHAMKGLAVDIGAESAADLLTEIEQMALQASIPVLQAAYQRFDREHRFLIEAIQSYLHEEV
jgi:CheY-like chemotaxis protein